MIFEPLAGKRKTIVTETRKAVNFVNTLKFTSDTMYPFAEKIILVTDNLNTHSPPRCCMKRFHRKKLTELRIGSSGIIPQSMEVDWISQSSKSALCAVKLLQNRSRIWQH